MEMIAITDSLDIDMLGLKELDALVDNVDEELDHMFEKSFV